jgi:hypothetical protein
MVNSNSVLHLVDRLADVLLIRAHETTKERLKRMSLDQPQEINDMHQHHAQQMALIKESRKREEAANQANDLRVANIVERNPEIEREAQDFYAAKIQWQHDVSEAVRRKTTIPPYVKKPARLLMYELSKQERSAEEYYAKEKQWIIDCNLARKNNTPNPSTPTKSRNMIQWEVSQQRVETDKETEYANTVRNAAAQANTVRNAST